MRKAEARITNPWEPTTFERVADWVMAVFFVVAVVGLLVAVVVGLVTQPAAATPAPDPSGVWAGLVDDLPSGRLVECVFARDPSGSVAVTCDWANAVRGRP